MSLLRRCGVCVCFLIITSSMPASSEEPHVKIGSKSFTESVILGELISHLVRSAGATADHQGELGGTRILWSALLNGDLDVYPEYTGTITQEILAGQDVVGDDAIRRAIAADGLRMSRPIGFNNTYAIGMKETRAEELGLRTISDLARHPDLLFAFSNEFIDRGDGWPSLRDRYKLPHQSVRGIEHVLAYPGLESGAIDATDLYSTDAEIRQYQLRVLQDDLGHFPTYNAVLVYRADLETRVPGAVAALLKLEGLIDDATMAGLNAKALIDRQSESAIAADFLAEALAVKSEVQESSVITRLVQHTKEHLILVLISLGAAIVVAVPLGILGAHLPRLGQAILGVTGIVQTIPSLALLMFMMALLTRLVEGAGFGAPPAIAALFLYSLLPIVRNTFTGLRDIPSQFRESAEALGLPVLVRLRRIELPMASRTILAGIKTAAVINVGFATLGAFIGAGGYGQPILTGLRLADTNLILEGAIPAAVMALLVQALFEFSERILVPLGLRLKPVE